MTVPVTALKYRMSQGFAGSLANYSSLTTEPAIMQGSNLISQYGLAGKYVTVNGETYFAPLTANALSTDIAGFLVRPYPTTSATDQLTLTGDATQNCDILKRGYMSVKVVDDGSSLVRGQIVNVLVKNPAADKPLGCIFATATADTLPLNNAYFMGKTDENGITAMAYNIGYVPSPVAPTPPSA